MWLEYYYLTIPMYKTKIFFFVNVNYYIAIPYVYLVVCVQLLEKYTIMWWKIEFIMMCDRIKIVKRGIAHKIGTAVDGWIWV